MPDFDLADYRRLVVKIGSTLLVRDNELDCAWLDSLIDDVAELCRGGVDVLLVSSGAIALGSAILGIDRRRARMESLQAAAAIGQVELLQAYRKSLQRHALATAQVLLTLGDTEDRRRFMNARSTLACLLDARIVPVINENDTVATDEIRYGDNDRLAARAAQLIMADGLVLLSDVDGLYTADPGTDPDARHLPEVTDIGPDIAAMAGGSRSQFGTGGMETKVLAARIATQAGCDTIIASGIARGPLSEIRAGARCTRFRAPGSGPAIRKQWLAGHLDVHADVLVDGGAATALAEGASLLPVGVVGVSGNFGRGDVVRIVNDGKELGRGVAEYSSEETLRLAGCHSAEIESRLGYRYRDVILHRDELVLT